MNWLRKNWGGVVVWGLIVTGVAYSAYSPEPKSTDTQEFLSQQEVYQENRGEVENSYTDFDSGYSWAEDNDVSSFDDCQDEFGTGEEEDGCNDYVKENYSGYQTFNGYECTEDCSGHEAGYDWAEENGIEDSGDCGGNSTSFIEGCESYVEDNY